MLGLHGHMTGNVLRAPKTHPAARDFNMLGVGCLIFTRIERALGMMSDRRGHRVERPRPILSVLRIEHRRLQARRGLARVGRGPHGRDLHRGPARALDLHREPTGAIVDQKAAAPAAVEGVHFVPGGPVDVDADQTPCADQILQGRAWYATVGGTQRNYRQSRDDEGVLSPEFHGAAFEALSPSTLIRRFGYMMSTGSNAAAPSALCPSVSSRSPRSSSNGLADQGGPYSNSICAVAAMASRTRARPAAC